MDHCLFDSSDRRPTETCPLSCRWDMGLLTDGGGSRITYDGNGTVPKNGLGRPRTVRISRQSALCILTSAAEKQRQP